jgi:pimeloyl-ACP methyl ester carboxylesterase
MTAIVPQELRVDELRVRFARGGKATGTPVLLTSPWPESIYAFREIWSMLEDVAPLVALDLPGFGKSESRPDVLNPPAMGEFLTRFIDELQLDRPHAVCPDVGTAASLYAAATRTDLFTSLTVGGGGMDENLVASTLKEIIEAPDSSAFELIDGADIVAGSIARLMQKTPGIDEMRDYRESYAGRRFVTSMAYVRDYPLSLPPLRAILPTISTPVLVLYGRHDPLVPPANAHILGRMLPHVRVRDLDSGHFAWQDAADAYGAAVRNWIGGEYRTV